MGVRKTYACFGGRIWKLATLDHSVATFSTALSRFRFFVKERCVFVPMLNLTMGGLADSP